MISVILLLILAVLLFGSSVVIGILGVALGFIAAAVALIWASIAFDMQPSTIMLLAGGGLAAFLAFGAYANRWTSQNAKAQMTPEERKIYEALQERAGVKPSPRESA